MVRYLSLLFFLLLSATLSGKAKAEDFIKWHTTNFQLLRGYDYKPGETQRSILTIEHVHGHKYGDTLIWADFIKPDGQNYTYYGELSPRLSLSKITGKDLSVGIIKDILISTTLEKAKDQGPQYLYGGAIDLNVPGFKFFKTNAYVHDSTELEGQTWQITLAWNRPFEIKGTNFLIEGFADIQGSEGDRESNQLIVPRFLMDVGKIAGLEDGKLMAGIEYQYWHNKFGLDGVTESVPQAQIKWTF